MQVVEKALVYFEKAALMQPNEPKWQMMVAGCHRRSGNLQKALQLYQDIHRQFPENTECLRFLARLCGDLGMREAQEYTLELKKLEKAKDVRERVASSRPGSILCDDIALVRYDFLRVAKKQQRIVIKRWFRIGFLC